MPFRRGRSVALIMAVAVLAAGVVASCGGNDGGGTKRARTPSSRPPVRTTPRTPPPKPVNAVPIHSVYETATRTISRDGGISVRLPDGTDLWLFGDTGVYERNGSNPWASTNFIDGSTSMLAKTAAGSVPSGIELPAGIPERFIPVPDDVYLPDGSGQPCTYDTAAFPARWPIGTAMFNENEVIVTYSIVCITKELDGQAVSRAEGWGYLLYNWRTRTIVQGPADVFPPPTSGALFPPARIFGSPHVENGTITLFSSQCDEMELVICRRGGVWSTSMPATTRALSNPASYKVTPLALASSEAWQPLSASVGHYGDEVRLVEMTTIVGNYRIFTAPNTGGPWHLARSGQLPGCPTRTGFCLALEGHAELSTASQTYVSYKDADSGPGGHIVISALPT
jgi:hypothetical protein